MDKDNKYILYIQEVGVCYLYLVLKALNLFVKEEYKISYDFCDLIDISPLISNQYKESINNIKMIKIEKTFLNNKYDEDIDFMKSFLETSREIIDGKKDILELKRLIKNEISNIIRINFDKNYDIKCDYSFNLLEKYIKMIEHYKKKNIIPKILNEDQDILFKGINKSKFINVSGGDTINTLTDFSNIYNEYILEKNELNRQISRTNEILSQKISEAISPLFNQKNENVPVSKALGIISVSNEIIEYYIVLLFKELINKELNNVSCVDNVIKLKEYIQKQEQFYSSRDIRRLME